MKDNSKAMNEVWEVSTGNFSKQQLPFSHENFDALLGAIFCTGPYYYYVIDFSSFPKLNLSYVDESVTKFYGMPKEKLTLNHVINQVHPGDLEFTAATEKVIMDFYANLKGPDEMLNYKSSFTIRFKNADGRYKLLQHQGLAISTDSKGKMAHAINIHTDVTHITNVVTGTMSILGLNGRPSYIGIDPLNPSFDKQIEDGQPYSHRELEIIRLSASGLKSKEMAEKLFISPHTVDKHRKNLLKKSTSQNMTEVVSKCIRAGLI